MGKTRAPPGRNSRENRFRAKAVSGSKIRINSPQNETKRAGIDTNECTIREIYAIFQHKAIIK